MTVLSLKELFKKLQPQPKPVQQPVLHDLVKWIEFGVCPDCGAEDRWQEGPSGGMCINFRCDGCGSKFNVAMPPLCMIQRIG